MSTDDAGRSAMLERLSALADGELDESSITPACLHWRGDAEVRASWHAYHLIGDVLRSDDLGCDPAHDAGFLEALRARLADEPVVLAPQSAYIEITAPSALVANGAATRRRTWMAPSAVAAGFVMVAGVLFATRAPDAGIGFGKFASRDVPQAVQTAQGVLSTPTVQGVGVAVNGVDAPSSVRNASAIDSQSLVDRGRLIRDVRLDRYLSAHKEFAGSSALGVPSGFLRNATAEAVDR